ncbi:hypothetical protein [Streptomyces sp. 2333.5]|uniref:hypothetical protein n=1 Tax=Streptomyces sp. 2333.5 TaxID=1938842 RepID=UPI00131ABE28|nr:hypothetical protein [Streptomyces sp. 2333.5]
MKKRRSRGLCIGEVTDPEILAGLAFPSVFLGWICRGGRGRCGGVAVATSSRGEVPGCRAVIVTSHGRTGHRERALEVAVRGFVPTTVSA